MLLISEEEVRELLPMKEAIRLLREAFHSLGEGVSQNQPRRRLVLPAGSVLHSMAGAHGGYFGTKVYTTNVRHGAHFLFLLCDAGTGAPLALFEANYLGQIRTGAASGLATDLLASTEASTLGVIGCGFQARSQVEAILTVRSIWKVLVWSRSAANRSRFSAECGEAFGVSCEAAASARDAVTEAEVVVTATYSKTPVIQADWIRPGTHINAIGSNNAARRELPGSLVRSASLIAVDSLEQARLEAGDLLLATPPSEWDKMPIVELADVCRGAVKRDTSGDTTIFKSNGLGIEDVAVAAYVYEKVKEIGVGRQIDWLYSGAGI
jgi:ornithine cyclodeaminase/alanine dehydrogenase-like protein (mu-crystallin family)